MSDRINRIFWIIPAFRGVKNLSDRITGWTR